MFAAFRLGAVWVPTNFSLMPDEVAYLATASGAKAFLCHGDFPEHAAAVKAASPALAFTWRIGEGAFAETSVSEAISAHAGATFENTAVDYDDPCWFFFTSGTTGRSKAAVLTHGQMAFVVTNHLADLMPGYHGARRVAGGGAAVAWRRRASAGAGRARRADHPAVHRAVRHRRGVPADRDPPRHQHLYRADHPEDDGRASRHRPLRSFLAALHHLCRRADVPRGPEGGIEETRQGAGAVFRARRGHRQHHGAAAGPARCRGRAAGADRHLRL